MLNNITQISSSSGAQTGNGDTNALRHLALAAQGMTGADVERLVREARQKARRAQRPLRYVDILDILHREHGSLPPDLRWRVSVHEAGHALLYTVTGAATVISVTTGRGVGGNTAIEYSTSTSQTDAEIMNIIACILAGRAAELEIFGDTILGSGGGERSDLALATASAAQLETVLGCSGEAPLLYVPSDRLGHDLRFDPRLAARVNRRLENALTTAQDVISRNRDKLVMLAEALNRASYLDGKQVAAILAQPSASKSDQHY